MDATGALPAGVETGLGVAGVLPAGVAVSGAGTGVGMGAVGGTGSGVSLFDVSADTCFSIISYSL